MLKLAAGYAVTLSALTLFTGAAAAQADMQVLESNITRIQVGTRISQEAVNDLPTGARVKVLLPSLKTKVFEGPSAGPTRSWGGTRGPKE